MLDENRTVKTDSILTKALQEAFDDTAATVVYFSIQHDIEDDKAATTLRLLPEDPEIQKTAVNLFDNKAMVDAMKQRDVLLKCARADFMPEHKAVKPTAFINVISQILHVARIA